MEKIKSPHLEVKEDWLKQLKEDPILPDLPIIDPHHHLWDVGFGRYYVEELLEDIKMSGHNIKATVYIMSSSNTIMYSKAVNISGKARVAKTRSDIMKHASVGLKGDELKAIHPVVRTHPETKKKSLYVNEAHTTNFIGMTEEESTPILEFLFKHQIKSEFTCRFQWKPGSVAIWDNRCTMHNPINDYHGQRRLMHRITFAGDKPM